MGARANGGYLDVTVGARANGGYLNSFQDNEGRLG